jgi:hypothetical protein
MEYTEFKEVNDNDDYIEPTYTLREQDIELIQSGLDVFYEMLRTGIGITRAARCIGVDGKEISYYCEKFPEVKMMAIKSVTEGYRDRIKMVNNLRGKKQLAGELRQAEADLRAYVGNITWWESFVTKAEMEAIDDYTKLIAASKMYNDNTELATACGFTEQELVELVTYKDYLISVLK